MLLFNDLFDFVSLLNTNSKQLHKKKFKVEHILYCDHCGKRIKYGEEVIQFNHNGIVYTFCKEDCKDKFVDENIKTKFIHYALDKEAEFKVKDYYYNNLCWKKELLPNIKNLSSSKDDAVKDSCNNDISFKDDDKKDSCNDIPSKERDKNDLTIKDNISDDIYYKVIVNGSTDKDDYKCNCSIVKRFTSKEEALDYYTNISFNEFDVTSKKLVKISGTSEEVLLSYK